MKNIVLKILNIVVERGNIKEYNKNQEVLNIFFIIVIIKNEKGGGWENMRYICRHIAEESVLLLRNGCGERKTI